jgi:hypothetical protein
MRLRYFAAVVIATFAAFAVKGQTLSRSYQVEIDVHLNEQHATKMTMNAVVGTPITWEGQLPATAAGRRSKDTANAVRTTLTLADAKSTPDGTLMFDFEISVELQRSDGVWIEISDPRIVTAGDSPAYVRTTKGFGDGQPVAVDLKLFGHTPKTKRSKDRGSADRT